MIPSEACVMVRACEEIEKRHSGARAILSLSQGRAPGTQEHRARKCRLEPVS
jgi:hypothetical protein